ncbi:MAG TPA: LacI family transcriptional regulator [Firmicutes bacterium]|nr:LacI family transcriptional regulator [Bacillota bacterium]
MSGRPVTQTDIAKMLGFSKSTVSRALNGDPRISPETRRKIEEEALKLNYKLVKSPAGSGEQPEAAGKALPGIKTITALVRNPALRSFYSEAFLVISEYGREASYKFDIDQAPEGETIPSGVRRCLQNGADAVFLFTREEIGEEDACRLQELKAPVILIGRHVEGKSAAVTFDDYAVGVLAARYLYRLGHRRIAYIAGPLHSTSQRERLAGFRMGLERLGCYNSIYFSPPVGDDVVGDVRIRVQQLLSLSRPPTAIWALNDFAAGIAIATIQMAGLSVPGDISVMGFDRNHLAASVSITTFDFRCSELGRQALYLLEGLVRGVVKSPVRLCVVPILIEGHSTGPPPAAGAE